MRKLIFLSLITLTGLFLFSCEKTTNSADELELDAVVEEQAAVGWEVNSIVSSSGEVEELTQNSEYLEDKGISDMSSVSLLKKQALHLTSEVKTQLPVKMSLNKTAGDSLIFFEEIFIGGKGIRKALYYDSETGIARYYEVVFQFPEWRNLRYDSSEVTVNVGSDLDNEADDYLVSFYQLQNFKDTFFIQKIESQLEVTDYDGIEITGVVATSDADYRQNYFLSHRKQSVELNPDKSGTLSDEFDYRDGKSSSRSVTFYADRTGTFSKTLRNGTTISGTFDCVEYPDDLEGSYSETIDFPTGRYLDKITNSVIISLTYPDSIFNGDFSKIIYFSSGRVDSAGAIIQIQEVGGVKTTTLSLTKANGAHGSFVIIEEESMSTLTGNWTTWNGYYIEISAEYYFDGSGHIHYEVYTSYDSFENGGSPIIIVDYYFSSDQTGNGTITYQGNTYKITFDDYGQASVSKDGKSKNINLFR